MSDIRIPEKDEAAIAKAVTLLRKLQTLKANDGSTIDILILGQKVKGLDKTVRSRAEARMRGEDRPGLAHAAANPGNAAAVAAEWTKTLTDHKDLKTKWGQDAIDSEKAFQASLKDFAVQMDKLISPLEGARNSNVPGVKGQAQDVLKVLTKARASVDPLSRSAGKAVTELEHFNLLVALLEGDPPETMDEVKGTRATFAEAIQAVRRTELDIKRQAEAINALSNDSAAAIESTIKKMVVAAVAWRQSKGTREGTEWAEALLNGAVGLVQLGAGEPLSGVAVQGLHMLIKGICDGVKGLAAAIEAKSLSKEKVDDLLDKLQADDFIQAKLDALKMGLSWVAEPLGFIPSVGTLVRAAINTGVGLVVGILKEAAEKQKKAMEAKKQLVVADFQSEIEEIGSTLKESILNTVKAGIESGPEVAKDFGELAKGAKDPAEFILVAVNAVLGPPLQKLLADVIPEFKLVDKAKIKADLQGARNTVQAMAGEMAKMRQINVAYAFDEASAKAATVAALDGMAKSASLTALVVASPELTDARGVALLIGPAHSADNLRFVNTLIEGGHGYEGTVTLLSTGMFGEIQFDFGDAKATGWVKSYVEHYGTGSKRITGKKLKFA